MTSTAGSCILQINKPRTINSLIFRRKGIVSWEKVNAEDINYVSDSSSGFHYR